MADDSIRIEYNEDLKPLEDLLASVERAGDFFVSGAVEIPMPKLEVEGVGVLSFPVPPNQVAALVQQATRAPYGRGEETILDESVRKVWQLSPNQVRIGGKSWTTSFEGILKQVVAGLGCEGMAVSAELYKLLVYDTGGFFKAHRDTEKAGGMFGTLVVVLPAAHRGGELVIRHASRETVVDMSGGEVSEAGFAAFYADCEHEVRPITEGNRVCLVYNLIQHGGAKKAERGCVEDQPQHVKRSNARKDPGVLRLVEEDTVHAPDYERQIAAAAALLKNNLAAPGAPAKIAWLLEHQYSPDGLSFAGLKSADAARAKVLAQAAERAGCAAHLGIVHIEESGAAQETYDFRPRGRGWYRDEDEDETEDASGEDFEIIEVCDWRHYISQWRDSRDQPVEFGEIPLAPGELLPTGALDDEKPDEQRLMEASGNEGASFERSYHRAALVIWRRERYAEVLLQAGVAAVLPYLKEKVEACLQIDGGAGVSPASSELESGSKRTETHGQDARATAVARKEAVALARQLVKTWSEAPEFAGYPQPARPDKRDGMLELLIKLGDADLLAEFIADVVTRDYDGGENAALVAGANLLGAEGSGRLFSELVRQQMGIHHGACVDLLYALTCVFPLSPRGTSGEGAGERGNRKKDASSPRPSPPSAGGEGEEQKIGDPAAGNMDWQSALRQIAKAAIGKLDEVGKAQHENEWMEWREPAKARAVDAPLVAKLLDALGELDSGAGVSPASPERKGGLQKSETHRRDACATTLRAAAAEKFAARPAVFEPVTILVPALALIRKWDLSAKRLWEHAAEYLSRRSGTPPGAPQDWRQDVKLSCSCADCRELQTFVLDPAEQVHRFRVKKERRQHLHQQIEKHSLDMTHVTDRKGSPQTLVCAKDRRSYQRRCEQYRQDIAALASLAELAARSNAPAAALKKIQAARALAAQWLPAKT